VVSLEGTEVVSDGFSLENKGLFLVLVWFRMVSPRWFQDGFGRASETVLKRPRNQTETDGFER